MSLSSGARRTIAVAMSVVVMSLLAPACSVSKPVEAQKALQGPQAVPVRTAEVRQQTVPVQVEAIGTVEPLKIVEVKSMVAGQLEKVHFEEGDRVDEGQILFTIDRRPYEAELKQAEANLARDKAQLENARVQAQRAQSMVREGIGQQQEYDQARTGAAVLEAAVQADLATIERVKIDLGYTTILSPLTGRTGDLMVHQGNLVRANDIALVTINQISPAYVSFTVPEHHLAEIRRFKADGELKVKALPPSGQGEAIEGTLSFVNNQIDRETGTIELKATFSNEDERLWPGQFVQAVLTLTSRPNTVVVPTEAVQAGQQGQFVFVVKPDETVESRAVVVGDSLNGDIIIEKGLQPGEIVVTEGQMRLVPGAKVARQEKAAPPDGETRS